MRRWKILRERGKGRGESIEKIIRALLNNRGLKTKREIKDFLNPPNPYTLNSTPLSIKTNELTKAVKRIEKAIDKKEQIIVFGDYDVDGICGTAILWETLNGLGAKVLPYIPHRIEEGYGLSIKGIENLKLKIENCKLIITVDNGIMANEAVDFANKNGIDIIITDHHTPGKRLPKADAIVHTTKLCGAGVAWALAQELKAQSSKRKADEKDSHLALVALAAIADMVPLLGANRTLTKYGLKKLQETKRIGLLELFKEAALNQSEIGVYGVGHIIAPCLNAMGRITHALDSLRLLCTKDPRRAQELAQKLGATNRERQQLTEETAIHAKLEVRSEKLEVGKLIFVSHESYQQGVIGLVAGKLVEEFYRPAIVVSRGEKYSKASARSVNGFNIIEFIREASEFLIDAGGHPMAAGFTVETEKLLNLQKRLEELAEKTINKDLLTRIVRIDCELFLASINEELYEAIQKFAPFGMGNPEPTFVSKKVVIEDMWLVGNDGKHLKLRISQKLEVSSQQLIFEAIAFGMGERATEFHIGDTVDIVYTIEQNEWDGNKRLQLKIKDLRISH